MMCSKQFEESRSYQKTCSPPCSEKLRVKICMICNANFETNMPNIKTCSPVCSQERGRLNSRKTNQRIKESKPPGKRGRGTAKEDAKNLPLETLLEIIAEKRANRL
jgi:hypothetical protein